MWFDKIRDTWYDYWIMKYIVKKEKLGKKIHKLIYKRFRWNEGENNEKLRISSRDF